jgi:Glycosyl hydrolases family 16
LARLVARASEPAPRAHSGHGSPAWPLTGRGWYAPDKVISVTNGTLDWYVHTQNGVHYVAAMVPMVPASGWGQRYGRYSFRFRADTIPGYKMVAILWPDSDNWGQGEIDFPEVSALTRSQMIYANMYAKGNTATAAPGPASGFTTSIAASGTGWHIATIEWAPGSLTTWLDGTKLGTFTAGVPDTSFHLVFQIETNLCNAAISNSVSGHVQLDWVTMYSRTH